MGVFSGIKSSIQRFLSKIERKVFKKKSFIDEFVESGEKKRKNKQKEPKNEGN